jgi:hypothetical protein
MNCNKKIGWRSPTMKVLRGIAMLDFMHALVTTLGTIGIWVENVKAFFTT